MGSEYPANIAARLLENICRMFGYMRARIEHSDIVLAEHIRVRAGAGHH
jgi:hypothetical protein